MRRVFALFQAVCRGHARGLLLPVSLAAFFTLASMGATALRIDGDEGLRQGASLALAIGSLILLVCASVMPLLSLPYRRRARTTGALSHRGVHGASLAAHGLLLLGISSGLAVAAIFVLGLRFGLTAVAGGTLPLRELLAVAPENGVRLRAGPDGIAVPLPSGSRRRVGLEMRPQVALLEGATASGAFGAKGSVALLSRSGAILHETPFDAQRGRTVRLALEADAPAVPRLEPRTAPAGEPGRLLIRLLDSGKELIFEPEAIQVLGEGRMLLPTLILGFHMAALRAFLLCVALHWFAGFTRYPIALMAAGTLMLLVHFLEALGGAMPDAGRLVASGVALTPTAAMKAMLPAGLAGAISVAATFIHHRIQENPR